jgi:hypothetical protein
MATFQEEMTGNELLAAILSGARAAGISSPKVYSHSLGYFLHEPGPLIWLPWEQERCPGRGDVRLASGNAFTMELSVTAPVAEWDGQAVTLAMEQDVIYTASGCRLLDGRQTSFYLI